MGHKPKGRPLEARLAEYRDGLAHIAEQLTELGDTLDARAAYYREKGDLYNAMRNDSKFVRDGAKLYGIIANVDLTAILNGEELPHFEISGVLPDVSDVSGN